MPKAKRRRVVLLPQPRGYLGMSPKAAMPPKAMPRVKEGPQPPRNPPPPHLLNPAKTALSEETRKVSFGRYDELVAAVESHEFDSLKKAIGEGEAADLEEKMLSAAKEALAEEERQIAVPERQVAAQSLSLVIDEGSAAGVEDAELSAAKKALAEEERKKVLGGEARVSLATAVKSRELDSLKDSIQEGEAAGLEEKELSLAKELLAQEERKAAAESSGSGGRRAGVYLQEAYHDMFQRWKASK